MGRLFSLVNSELNLGLEIKSHKNYFGLDWVIFVYTKCPPKNNKFIPQLVFSKYLKNYKSYDTEIW